jgi:hypothetical protein
MIKSCFTYIGNIFSRGIDVDTMSDSEIRDMLIAISFIYIF